MEAAVYEKEKSFFTAIPIIQVAMQSQGHPADFIWHTLWDFFCSVSMCKLYMYVHTNSSAHCCQQPRYLEAPSASFKCIKQLWCAALEIGSTVLASMYHLCVIKLANHSGYFICKIL